MLSFALAIERTPWSTWAVRFFNSLPFGSDRTTSSLRLETPLAINRIPSILEPTEGRVVGLVSEISRVFSLIECWRFSFSEMVG